MLLTKEVEVGLGTKNIRYYEDLGYEIPRVLNTDGKFITPKGSTLLVKIEDLNKGSHIKVDVLCDLCKDKITNMPYREYIDRHTRGFDCCQKCSRQLTRETCIKRYGFDNPSKSPEIKAKIKQVFLEKYGTEYAMQSKDIKDKMVQTCLNKYGVRNPSQSKEVQEKREQTFLDMYGATTPLKNHEIREKINNTIMSKYGVENISQSNEIKEAKKQTCLQHYGVEYPAQSDEIKEKIKNTSCERYGVDSYLKTQEFKDKSKQTCLELYGVDKYQQTDEFKNYMKDHRDEIQQKRINTCINRYGVEHVLQNKEFKEKQMVSFMNTMYANALFPTSSQQLSIFNMLQEYYGIDNVFLNFPCGNCALDVVVKFVDVCIDVEYDGAFWHRDKNKDRRRDEFVKAYGYKILRIKSNRIVPDITDLVNAIEDLRCVDHTYNEIVLPDWKIVPNNCKVSTNN